MNQEIHQITQLLLQLKIKYEMSHYTLNALMLDYFKKEYQKLRIKLRSLEKLSANNDLPTSHTLAEAQLAVEVLELYLMV